MTLTYWSIPKKESKNLVRPPLQGLTVSGIKYCREGSNQHPVTQSCFTPKSGESTIEFRKYVHICELEAMFKSNFECESCLWSFCILSVLCISLLNSTSVSNRPVISVMNNMTSWPWRTRWKLVPLGLRIQDITVSDHQRGRGRNRSLESIHTLHAYSQYSHLIFMLWQYLLYC